MINPRGYLVWSCCSQNILVGCHPKRSCKWFQFPIVSVGSSIPPTDSIRFHNFKIIFPILSQPAPTPVAWALRISRVASFEIMASVIWAPTREKATTPIWPFVLLVFQQTEILFYMIYSCIYHYILVPASCLFSSYCYLFFIHHVSCTVVSFLIAERSNISHFCLVLLFAVLLV